MSVPVVGAFAQRIYNNLSPYTYAEEEHDYPLLTYLGAGGDSMFQEIEDLASDDADGLGTPGWSVLLDADNIPAKGIPWLGQYVGAVVDLSLSEANQRSQLKNVSGHARGSLAAIKAAPLPYLTGTKRVLVRERDAAACVSEPAYGLTVITITSETTDTAKVLAAIIAQKPAGIILDYHTLDGQDYDTLEGDYADYNAVNSHYMSYDGVRTDTTGI